MKIQKSVKDLQIAAVDAARDLLTHVPHLVASSVRHDQRLGSDYPIDGRIEFDHGDDTYALVIEVKSNGAPRFVRSAVYQLMGYLAHARQSGHGDSDRRLIPCS